MTRDQIIEDMQAEEARAESGVGGVIRHRLVR
jgi:hypothetical protein